jgi:predicted transcriptional regulator
VERGWDGFTADEVARVIGRDVHQRLAELVRVGAIVSSDRTRPSDRGRAQRVRIHRSFTKTQGEMPI